MNCCSFGSVLLVCSSFNVCVWIKTNIPGSVYVVFTQWFPEWGAGAPGGQFSRKTAVLLLVYSVLNHVQWTLESSPVSMWGVGDGAPTNLGTTVSTHVCRYNERCRSTHRSNTVSVSVYLKNNWLLICDVCHTDLVKLHLVNISALRMHQCMVKPSQSRFRSVEKVRSAAESTELNLCFFFLLSGTSRGPSPVTLASQDALPIAVAFTESVNAYFKGADPSKWVSHDLRLLKSLCHGPARTYVFVHNWT